MTLLGDPLAWCVVQITLVGLLAWAMCIVVRRWSAAGHALVPAAALAAIVILTICAFVPWPSWWRFGPSLEALTSVTPTSLDASRGAEQAAPPDSDQSIADQPASAASDAGASSAAPAPAFDTADNPRSEPIGHAVTAQSRAWPAWLGRLPAVLLGIGIVAGLLQLVGGLLSVRTCRRSSRLVENSRLREQLDVLQAELGLTCPIELRESDRLMTAATCGWRRPIVLLPLAWRDWTEDQRRAVLAHELAHVASGDYLTCVLAQLGLALHFYHPLVHWLVARLRLEQELAADATAAALAGGRRAYLTTLAELALHSQERSLGWPAHTFLPTPGTFLRRIEMLRDSKPDLVAAPRRRRAVKWLAVGALVLGAALIAGLRGGNTISPFDRYATAQTPPANAARAESSTAIDLRHVANDAKMFVAIRPAQAMALEEIRTALSDVPAERGQLLKLLSAGSLQQVTMVATADLDSWDENLVIILQFDKATSIEDLVKNGSFPMEIQRVPPAPGAAGAESRPGNMAAGAADEKTIILGQSEIVLKYLASRRKGKPAIAAGDAWQKVQMGTVAAALDMEAIRSKIEGEPGRPAPEIVALSPLWKDSEYLTAGIILEGKTVHFRAVATCANADLAGDVADTTQAAITLARNTLRSIREREKEQPALAILAMQTAEGLLKTMKVERSEALVIAQTSTSVPEVSSVATSGLIDAVSKARGAAQRQVSMNNLKQIMLAMHNWADVHGGRFPPPVIYGKDGKGKVPHSWRVELLPYLDQQRLYEAYNFDESWDSETNKKVLAQIPPFFRHPLDDEKSTNAAYFVVTTEMLLAENAEKQLPTAFSKRDGVRFADMLDGTSNTLGVVEAKRDIPWTRPDDILFDPDKDAPSLGGYFKEGFLVGICDGSVRFISNKVEPKVLKLLIMPQDGNPLPELP